MFFIATQIASIPIKQKKSNRLTTAGEKRSTKFYLHVDI